LNKYYIRYNTKHGDSDLVWRVFENNKEFLVKDFRITAPMYGEKTVEYGVTKYNVCCQGEIQIIDDIAYIN
jgi:hypothetical protein